MTKAMSRQQKFDKRWKLDDLGCYIWIGHINVEGYPRFFDGDNEVFAHRWIVNVTDPDIHVHHLCGVPACVNPKHLLPMPADEHRALHRILRRARNTHCVHGHDLEQSGFVNGRGHRECLTCVRRAKRDWARRKAAMSDSDADGALQAQADADAELAGDR